MAVFFILISIKFDQRFFHNPYEIDFLRFSPHPICHLDTSLYLDHPLPCHLAEVEDSLQCVLIVTRRYGLRQVR